MKGRIDPHLNFKRRESHMILEKNQFYGQLDAYRVALTYYKKSSYIFNNEGFTLKNLLVFFEYSRRGFSYF